MAGDLAWRRGRSGRRDVRRPGSRLLVQ